MSAATATIIGGVGAAVAAGATIYGANKSASAVTGAANTAAGEQAREFNLANNEAAPTRALGYGADLNLAQLFGINGVQGAVNGATGTGAPGTAGGGVGIGTPTQTSPNYSGFENNPGFKFAENLGEQGFARQNAANGSLYSPGTATQQSQFATGFASQNYNNYVSQLLQAAGMGSTSQTATGQQAVQTGQGVSNSITNAGLANASGISGSAGAIGGLATNNNFLNMLKGIGTSNPSAVNSDNAASYT